MNQIICKVAPALAAGCTMVLKPSEVAPLSAHHVRRDPARGRRARRASSTSSTATARRRRGDVRASRHRHGVVHRLDARRHRRSPRRRADTVKRVAQELGGKSANIILDDADFATAVDARRRAACFNNTGQSCNAPTRMLVPRARLRRGVAIAKADRRRHVVVGDPQGETTTIGPVVSKVQFEKIQRLIEKGIDEGADAGRRRPRPARGPRPRLLTCGRRSSPNVRNDMTIAREEIFGPVLVIIRYDDEDDAVRIANDTPYGLSGLRVVRRSRARAARGPRLRTGNVHLNGATGRLRGAVRRLQAVGQRPRVGRVRLRGVPRGEGRDGRREMSGGAAASVATGAEALVRTLVACGVDTCFTNPGTSEMHFVAALDSRRRHAVRARAVRRRGDRRGRRLRAHGRRPASTLLHLGPGLANGLANLHNAHRALSPVVNIVGEHAHVSPQYDPPLHSNIEALARRVLVVGDVGRVAGRPPRPRRPTRSRQRSCRPAGSARSSFRPTPPGANRHSARLRPVPSRRARASTRTRVLAAAESLRKGERRADSERAAAADGAARHVRPHRGRDRRGAPGADTSAEARARRRPCLRRPHSVRHRIGAEAAASPGARRAGQRAARRSRSSRIPTSRACCFRPIAR